VGLVRIGLNPAHRYQSHYGEDRPGKQGDDREQDEEFIHGWGELAALDHSWTGRTRT
jgi:hypothetical protein